MAKSFSRICAAWITACTLFSSGSALADAKYGFAARCDLWSTLLPISFQHDVNDNEHHVYNIIWIDGEGVSGLESYYSLYRHHSGASTWPNGIASGKDTPQCTGTYNACAYEDWGSVGKGISAYDSLKREFPSETINVTSGNLARTSDALWLYLPVRKFKLLRVELFTPYTSGPGNKASQTYNEPLSFEYRATGNGSELKLQSWGSTSDITSSVKLPNVFNPTETAEIQVWTDEHNNHDWSGLDPAVTVDSFTTEQMKLVPESCR